MKKLKAVLSLAMVLLLVWTMSGCKARVQEENAAADTEIFDVQQEAAPPQGTQADEPKKDESQKETVVDSSGGEIGGVIYDEVSKEKWLAEAELVLLGRVTEKKGEEDIPEQRMEDPSIKGVQAAHRRTVYTVMIDTLYKGVCAEGSVAVSVSNPLDYLKGEPYVTDPFELEIGKEYLFLLNWLNDEYFATETRTFLPDQAGGYANCTSEDPLRMTLSTEDLKAIDPLKKSPTDTTNVETEEQSPSFSTVEDLADHLNSSSSEKDNTTQSVQVAKKYFYRPAADLSGYELWKIEENKNNITFWYLPTGTKTSSFLPSVGIEYVYLCREFETKEAAMEAMRGFSKQEPTADGIIYEANWNRAFFLAEKSIMMVRVPNNMNTYEQIKSLCVATRYEVDAEHRGK